MTMKLLIFPYRFEFDFTGKFMLCMFAQGVLLFSITLMIQYRVFLNLQQKLIKLIIGPQTLNSPTNPELVDDDVKHENERVLGKISRPYRMYWWSKTFAKSIRVRAN